MRAYSSGMLASFYKVYSYIPLFYKVTKCHIPEDIIVITAMRNSYPTLDLTNSMELKPFREATSCATTRYSNNVMKHECSLPCSQNPFPSEVGANLTLVGLTYSPSEVTSHFIHL
jgi:hypothetical protein